MTNYQCQKTKILKIRAIKKFHDLDTVVTDAAKYIHDKMHFEETKKQTLPNI